MVLGLGKNGILSTPMKDFFVFFLAARHPADFDGCPTAGAKALASVSLIPWHPCHSRPALHRRVPLLRCEHSISVSARHFLVVLHISDSSDPLSLEKCLSVCLCLCPDHVRALAVRQKVQPLRLDKIVFSDEKMFRVGESRLSAQNCRTHTSQERNGDESRCLHRVDPGGSKRCEEEHRELAQATPHVHRKRGRQLRIRPREARVVD